MGRVRIAAAVVCACTGAAIASPPKTTTLKAEATVAEGPFPTQRDDLSMYRDVGESFTIGSSLFGAVVDGDTLRMATASGSSPTKRVKAAGAVVSLEVAEDDATRTMRIHVRRNADATWEWAPVDARVIEIDRVVIELLDANADGRITLAGDALRYPPSRFVLPLGPEVIAGRNRLTIESVSEDARRIVGTVEPLEGSRHQLDGLVLINELRADHGLPPVVVDATLSEACSAHAEYLVKNKWTPNKFNPHFEHPRMKSYSEAGHRAGMQSVIAWSDHSSAAQSYWDTYYHRFPLAHPGTPSLGLSDESPSVSVIDGKSATDWSGVEGWQDPILVPADGSQLVTGNFHRGGESPEPVEQPGNRGFPLTVQFLTSNAGVSDFVASLVEIDKKGRRRDVPLLTPAQRRSGNRFGAIPERPLRSGVDYEVTYTFTRFGETEERTATFRVE